MKLARIFHTIRYLKPIQLYGRVWFVLHRPQPDLRPPPPLRVPMNPPVGWIARQPRMFASGDFIFLNKKGGIDEGWDSPIHSRLWRYNLHYFDDLNCRDAESRGRWHHDLVDRWIAENPPGQGVGWEPYPLSLRIVNWIKWCLKGNKPESAWLHNLAVQTRYLSRRMEFHLLGNHLVANAKALVFAGLFFQGKEADKWLTGGICILEREIDEQLLADGGHFERSPMYHGIFLEDLLDLLNVAKIYPGVVQTVTQKNWEKSVQNMRFWLASMIHPDEEISFFNDAAFGVAADYLQLDAYARELGCPPVTSHDTGITRFDDSGYIRVAGENITVILDVAPIGPDYLPAHAHADTLSFEMSLFNQRVVVNSGTSCYGPITERTRQRGTGTHSTVEVDLSDSSEVWGQFRVARRAKPFGLSVRQVEQRVEVSCSHNGYSRLSGRPIHTRQWVFGPSFLKVYDRLQGGNHEGIARYYLHPSIEVYGDTKKGYLMLHGKQCVNWQAVEGEADIVPSTYHPEFGLSIPSRCIELHLRSKRSCMLFYWN